jgi:hypothetical protein
MPSPICAVPVDRAFARVHDGCVRHNPSEIR